MRALLSLCLAAALAACGSPGKLVFTTYGEDFIEKGIAAEEFEDGWSVTFSKFLVGIGEITVDAADGTRGASLPEVKAWDVVKPGPVVIGSVDDVVDRAYENVSFAITGKNLVAGNASEADLALMKDNGYAVYVEGSASKGDVTKTFRWGFGTDTLYERCTPDGGEPGLTVPSGAEVKVDLTIHGDHLFLDDLQSEESVMRFDAIAAADTDDDGEVTLEELAQVDLTTLPLGSYGTGSVADVNSLRDFITAQIHTLGHFQGEGECSPRSR